MVVTSTVGSYGVDYWFHRQNSFKAWVQSIFQDTTCLCFGGKSTTKKEEDLVVVDSEEDMNGEGVNSEMNQERRMQRVRAWFSGLALAMGIVGLWGDKA